MAYTHIATTNSTTGAISVPAGVSNGNLLIAYAAAISATPTAPAGWTQVGAEEIIGTRHSVMWYRVAASEPASYTWTGTGSGFRVIMSAYGGFTGTPTLDAEADRTNGTSSTTITFPSVTLGQSNDLLIACVSVSNSSATVTPPTGFTEPTNGETTGAEISYLISSQAAGAYTPPNASCSTSQTHAVYIAGFYDATITTSTRTVPVAAAVTVTGQSRSVPVAAKVSVVGQSRSVPVTAAVSVVGQTRPVPVAAAVKTTNTRAVPMTAKVSVSALTRTVPTTAAVTVLGQVRTVPVAAAVKTTGTRSVPITAAVIAPVTSTRAVPVTAAVAVTSTRSVPVAAKVSVSGVTRSVPVTSAVSVTGLLRTVPVAAAVKTTNTRSVPTTAAVQTTNARAVPVAASVAQTSMRSVPVAASVSARASRSVPVTAAVDFAWVGVPLEGVIQWCPSVTAALSWREPEIVTGNLTLSATLAGELTWIPEMTEGVVAWTPSVAATGAVED